MHSAVGLLLVLVFSAARSVLAVEEHVDQDEKQLTSFMKEVYCQVQLMNTPESLYQAMAFVVIISSLLLLVVAIFVYNTTNSLITTQLHEAEKNAHNVMDAILAVLIPQSLLSDIAAPPEEKKKK